MAHHPAMSADLPQPVAQSSHVIWEYGQWQGSTVGNVILQQPRVVARPAMRAGLSSLTEQVCLSGTRFLPTWDTDLRWRWSKSAMRCAYLTLCQFVIVVMVVE
jgi:hypothetical protein